MKQCSLCFYKRHSVKKTQKKYASKLIRMFKVQVVATLNFIPCYFTNIERQLTQRVMNLMRDSMLSCCELGWSKWCLLLWLPWLLKDFEQEAYCKQFQIFVMHDHGKQNFFAPCLQFPKLYCPLPTISSKFQQLTHREFPFFRRAIYEYPTNNG